MFLKPIMTRVLQALGILSLAAARDASVLAGIYGGFSPSTAISVERERIALEIARIEDEIEKFKRLELAA